MIHDQKQTLLDAIRCLLDDERPHTAPERFKLADALIIRYIENTGQRPPAEALTLLADYLMKDYISDRSKRTSQTEYPWLTDTQMERRTDVEAPFVEHT